MLDSALRVDQAGEVAANYIYKGQHFILGRDKATGPMIQVQYLLHPTIRTQGLTSRNRKCGSKRRNI